jgi:hypothetical protein
VECDTHVDAMRGFSNPWLEHLTGRLPRCEVRITPDFHVFFEEIFAAFHHGGAVVDALFA